MIGQGIFNKQSDCDFAINLDNQKIHLTSPHQESPRNLIFTTYLFEENYLLSIAQQHSPEDDCESKEMETAKRIDFFRINSLLPLSIEPSDAPTILYLS